MPCSQCQFVVFRTHNRSQHRGVFSGEHRSHRRFNRRGVRRQYTKAFNTVANRDFVKRLSNPNRCGGVLDPNDHRAAKRPYRPPNEFAGVGMTDDWVRPKDCQIITDFKIFVRSDIDQGNVARTQQVRLAHGVVNGAEKCLVLRHKPRSLSGQGGGGRFFGLRAQRP